MNGVQTRFKCKLDVKRCKRFVFPPSSLLPRSNALKTKAIRYFQTDRTLTRIVSPPLRATFVKEFRKEHPDMLLFDCGDISQGTPYYNMFQGEVEVKMMNEMKYDAMTIGNHEFDFDLDNMARLFRMADFPVVCANYDVSATVLKDLVKPYVVFERDGVKIGVLGLGCQLEGMVQANKCVGVVYNDPVTVANEVAAVLKEKEGCDVVVCLSHLGVQYDENQLIPKTRNIDVVLGGHSHTFMKGPKTLLNMDGKNVSLMHTGKSGIYVGQMDLTLEKKK